MDTTEKSRKNLEMQMNAAEEYMEQKREELNVITKAIMADPSRNLCEDENALRINKELSDAILEYVRLEKLFMKDKSKFI